LEEVEMMQRTTERRRKIRRRIAKGFVSSLMGVMMLGTFWSGLPAAEEKSTVEEILDILQSRGVINEQEYQELLDRAKAEAESAAGQQPSNTFRVFWKDGLRMETSDDAFQLRLGGRIMADFASINADSDTENFFGDDEDFGHGGEIRRARLYMQGTLYDSVEFKTQFDFAGGEVEPKDIYLGLKGIPYIGRIRVGHLKEPVSLEQMTSTKYITFMERSLMDALIPGRNLGVSIFDNPLNDRLGWSFGFYRDVNDEISDGFSDQDKYNLAVRLRGLPWYAEEGRKLLHLGLSYSHKFRSESDGTTLRFRSRPEAHLSPFYYVDTGDFLTSGVDLINPELALVYGPFSFQGEYALAMVDRSLPNPDFWGFYVYGSYFITGENRVYKGGDFDRVKPKHNFLAEGGGLGAWEVALRYSYLDLADAGLGTVNGQGGKLGDLTFGLNWYLNPNVRWMFNYVYADLDEVGDTNIFETRFQIDF
jgi:phosphate-selective porin OprO/OprP